MKKALCQIIFVVSLLFSGQVKGQHALILSGDREAQQGNHNGAISYYLDALEKFPFNYHLFYKLGESYRLKGEFGPALQYYEKCMITGKFHKKDSCRYAELLLMNGRIEKAVSAFEELLRAYPDDPEVIRMLGCCRFAASELSKPGLPPVRACEELNSPRNESVLAHTGEGLLFSSNRPGRDFLTIDDLTTYGGTDFYLARRNEKTNDFDHPVRIPGKLNSPKDETGFTMSLMSQMSFFSRCEPWPGKCRIFSARKIKKTWTDIKPETLGGEAFNFDHPALSSDGKTLWFVSDMPGGMGGKDLWKASVMPSGEIREVMNAGSLINTNRDEDYPSVWGDSLLFFSSEGHIGMGGIDIFYSRLKGNRAGQVVNASAPVNSTADDFSVCPDPNSPGGFFCSNRKPAQSDDIFAFRQPFWSGGNSTTEILTDTAVAPVYPPLETVVKETESLTITVSDPPSGDGIPAHPVEAEISSDTMNELEVKEEIVYHRIQIAASVKLINSVNQFARISDLIDLYGLSVEKAGNLYKYRIGNFESKEETASVLLKLRERGFRDCFVVTFK